MSSSESEDENEDCSETNIASTSSESMPNSPLNSRKDIKKALDLNLGKYNLLNKLEWELKSLLISLKRYELTLLEEKSEKNKKDIPVLQPYFKDVKHIPCKPNKDTDKLKKLDHAINLPHTTITRITWTQTDKINLALGVYEFICNKRLQEVRTNMVRIKKSTKFEEYRTEMVLLRKYHTRQILATYWIHNTLEILKETKASLESNTNEAGCSDHHSYLQDELNTLEIKLYYLKLISEWRKPIDWEEISEEYLKNRHKPIYCKAFWDLYLNPGISKKVWTEEQNTRLMEISSKFNRQNWEAIANELNINKTAYQCCLHFYAKLYDKLNRGNWTEQEDALVRNIIETKRTGNIIPWAEVTRCHPYRTRSQIYERFKYCLMPVKKKGKFSLAEDILLRALVKIHGPNFTVCSQFYSNRTSVQLRSRYTFIQNENTRRWTVDEDREIMNHVEKYGEMNWNLTKIKRPAGTIRHRYHRLKKWFEQNPNGKLKQMKRRRKTTLQQRYYNRNNIITAVVKKLLRGIGNNKYNFRVLNTANIERIIQAKKTIVTPKRKRGRYLTSESSLNNLILDYFHSTHSHLGRTRSIITRDMIEESSARIKLILELLNASIQLPSLTQIQAHPQLDEFDKAVLTQLSSQNTTDEPQPSTSKSVQPSSYFLPPSLETILGLRGLLLHKDTLLDHAKGIYKHIYDGELRSKSNKGLEYYQRQIKENLMKLDSDTHTKVLIDRQLFFERFYKIFKYPSLLSKSPPEKVGDEVEAPKKQTKKTVKRSGPGRPKKNLTKIHKMNEIRRQKNME